MPSYAFRDAAGDLVLNVPEFVKPIPAHAQTPGALMAVEAVRAAGKAKRWALEEDYVTDHGVPPVEPYERPEIRRWTTKKGKRKSAPTGVMLPADPVTAGARALLVLAEERGFVAQIIALADRCTVEGYDAAAGVAFRAYWRRGSADGGSWHERAYRYTLVSDSRPVGVHKTAYVGLAGKRPAGVGTTRLSIIGSPMGIPCNITEITRRVKEHGS